MPQQEPSVYIERVRDLETEVRRLQNAVEELTVLNDISVAAGKGLSVDETLNTVVEKARKAVGAEQGSLLIATGDGVGPMKTLIRQDERTTLRQAYHVGVSITGYVLHKAESLLIQDLSSDERFEPTDEELASIRSILCVPVFSRGLLNGAMMMVNKREGGCFTQDDLRMLTVVAGLAGELLQNRQLQDEALRRQEELTLSRVKEEKQREINETKTRFFSNISHDVRTPLTLMLAPLEELASSISTPGEKKRLDMVRHNALRLLRMINQLLDVSKVEAGAETLHASKGDLARCFRTIVAAFESLARQRGIGLECETPEALEASFDRDKLEKVVYNLVSNALTFTPPGGTVSIRLKLRESPGHEPLPDQAEIVVEDTGIGIPEEERERIFDRFFQGQTAEGRDRGGSGIGLALVKEYVELHGGTVSVTSDEGKGSTFVVRLPRFSAQCAEKSADDGSTEEGPPAVSHILDGEAEDPDKSGQAEPTSRAGHEGRGRTGLPLVLVVEDNPDMRVYLREHLEHSYRVLEAPDGRQGLELATEIVPDVVISDVLMPEVSGDDLCRRLKDDIRTSHIPVILLTAKAGLEDKLSGLESGADEYLAKPFVWEELKTRVGNLIEQRRRLRERFSRRVVFQPGELEIPSRDEAFLLRVHEIVEANLGDESFGVDDLARGVSLSYSQLHRKIQALTGQPPTHYVRNIRLRRALEMLKRNAGTVSEIAFSVGFTSPAYFTKCFHRLFGMLPSEVGKL
jgi:signal transduction histidine kinase/AraC-like DNA-binding protein/ActR/RegA family two-component response regulator